MASLAPYNITLGGTDYPAKYAGLLSYIEPYLTNLETFSFSGGNVGIGTSSPTAKLDVNGDAIFGASISTGRGVSTGDANIELGGLRSGDGDSFVDFHSRSGTDYESRLIRKSGVNGRLELQNTGTGDMWLLQLGASNIVFFTSNIDRARITSGGDLLVGATTASAIGNTVFGTATPGVIHQNNNAAATGFVFTSYRRSSVEIGSVSQNGTTAVLYNTTSDRRLKDNIVPAPSASDVIDAIQIVSHDWKAALDEHVTYGVIAQDLHAVAPQAVLEGDDGDEIEKTWGVDYSKLVPMLIKEIQSLRARVAALEQA